MRLFRIVMGALVLAAAVPLMSRIAMSAASAFYGCTGEALSCLAGGRESSSVILALAGAGGFLFATLPVFMALLIHWTIVELIYLRLARREWPRRPVRPASSRA